MFTSLIPPEHCIETSNRLIAHVLLHGHVREGFKRKCATLKDELTTWFRGGGRMCSVAAIKVLLCVSVNIYVTLLLNISESQGGKFL